MDEEYKESLTIGFPYMEHILEIVVILVMCVIPFGVAFTQAYTRTFNLGEGVVIHDAPLSMVIPAYIIAFVFAVLALAVIFFEIKYRIKAPLLKKVTVDEDGVTFNMDRILYSEGKKIKICKPSKGMTDNEINIEVDGKRYFAGKTDQCKFALGLLRSGIGRYYPEGIQEEE